MARYLYLRWTLRDTKIWRRVRIRQTYRLSDLHNAIQSAMGWHDAHLYEFVGADGHRALCPHGEDFGAQFGGAPSGRAAKMKVSSMLSKKGDQCHYSYDFGDGWQIDIEVERVANESGDDPWLLDGALSGPPEDCGGVPGYERCAEFVRTRVDPHDEGDSLRIWLGDWTPDGFASPMKAASPAPKDSDPLASPTAIDERKLEEGALAILALSLHDGSRAWKNLDWSIMNALHARGWISDPHSKAKCVSLSEEGVRLAEEFTLKYFGASGNGRP